MKENDKMSGKKQQSSLLVRALSLVFLFLLVFFGGMFWLAPSPSESHLSGWQTQVDRTSNGTLVFTGKKALVLEPVDQLGRAQGAHIQLRDRDEPHQKRESRITVDPVGWHNYKLPYGDGSQKAWLMSRGHLIGYQFSGLNSERRNLVPMTNWLNAGNYRGMDDSNSNSMLYYENRLDDWLAQHPNDWLDYEVTPIYQGSELIPRQIRLRFVGLTANGDMQPITFNSSLETQTADGVTQVILENTSPNASIDYQTGRAQSRVTGEKTVGENSQERIVYVANKGQSKVYWYDRQQMPARTKQNRVISLPESQALAQGKTHSPYEK